MWPIYLKAIHFFNVTTSLFEGHTGHLSRDLDATTIVKGAYMDDCMFVAQIVYFK